jgi:hypothetical protein
MGSKRTACALSGRRWLAQPESPNHWRAYSANRESGGTDVWVSLPGAAREASPTQAFVKR